MRNMSGVRLAWVIWCLMWAGFWAVSLIVGNVFAFILAPLSACAVLIPIGKGPKYPELGP